MSNIRFRIAAKTDVGSVRTNNEDNFQAAADLSAAPMRWINNQTYDLGPKGALLVVADGMGGMNAGEVASDIAINTIKEFFSPERITPEVTKSRFTIEKYMKDSIVEADRRIKAASNVETRGMGTTVVMAWLYNGQCYVCWCGDSRAYIFNPANGLFQVSKDHSYVQGLVDEGKISQEDAFDYPDSNIITRCLCDAKAIAEPECPAQPQPLCDGDIILLCSDGLSGMLRDRDMQQIIRAHTDNMDVCVDELIAGALRAGGNDNVTVAVAQIESGAQKADASRIPVKTVPKRARTAFPGMNPSEQHQVPLAKKGLPAWMWGVGGVVVAAGIFTAAYLLFLKEDQAPQENETATVVETRQTPDVNGGTDEKGYKPNIDSDRIEESLGTATTKPNRTSTKSVTPNNPKSEPGKTSNTDTKPEEEQPAKPGQGGGIRLTPVENIVSSEPENIDTPKTPSTPKRPFRTYTVKKKDTLTKIADKNGCTVDEIIALNRGDEGFNPEKLKTGQVIKIPQKGEK